MVWSTGRLGLLPKNTELAPIFPARKKPKFLLPFLFLNPWKKRRLYVYLFGIVIAVSRQPVFLNREAFENREDLLPPRSIVTLPPYSHALIAVGALDEL